MNRKSDGYPTARGARRVFGALVLGLAFTSGAAAQQPLVGMGDSIGEGVQAADAAFQTQPFSYINLVSSLLGEEQVLPLIRTNAFGAVDSTRRRSRLFPFDISSNVAVSGANLDDLLNARADATTVAEIDDELDLVMFPRQQSQMEYAESVAPGVILCWIGNNDVLATVTGTTLDASQLTPVEAFEANYTELADRLAALKAANSKIVLLNIPNVTEIGIVLGAEEAAAITGFPVNLPDGSFTNLPAVFLMMLLGDDGLVSDPDFVLDPDEIALIEARIDAFNAIIESEAARIGVPVVDANSLFADLVANPPEFFGIPLSKRLFGGLFSNDLVHPSNIAHGLVANEVVRTLNSTYAMDVPELPQEVLALLFLTDPSIDKDLDGRATGRLGVGLIETLLFVFGMTGDFNDFVPN